MALAITPEMSLMARMASSYVNARWLGGMLTNFKTMRGRVERLNQLKKMQEDGTFDMLPRSYRLPPASSRSFAGQ